MHDNRTNANRVAAMAAAVLVIGLLVAAAPTPTHAQSKASTKAVDSLNAVIKEVTKGRDQVQGAMDALNALTSGGTPNLTKNYKTFSKEVAGLTKTKQTAAKRVEEMKARREAYLEEWQQKAQEVSSPEIQVHMKARAEEVKKNFESLQPVGQSIREAFPPFLSDLQDIDTLLSVDLSASGVAAATPIGQKAVANGNIVLQGLDTYLTTLTQIRDETSPKKK